MYETNKGVQPHNLHQLIDLLTEMVGGVAAALLYSYYRNPKYEKQDGEKAPKKHLGAMVIQFFMLERD